MGSTRHVMRSAAPQDRGKAIGLRASRAPSHGPNGGVADSLDEAKAAVPGGVGAGASAFSGIMLN